MAHRTTPDASIPGFASIRVVVVDPEARRLRIADLPAERSHCGLHLCGRALGSIMGRRQMLVPVMRDHALIVGDTGAMWYWKSLPCRGLGVIAHYHGSSCHGLDDAAALPSDVAGYVAFTDEYGYAEDAIVDYRKS